MLNKTTFTFLFFLYVTSMYSFAYSNPSESRVLISRCISALKQDMNLESTRQLAISLIQEIKENKEYYLISAMFPDVRQYYERLHVKLGDYYFNREDLFNACQYYIEADRYSVNGYKEKIAACRSNLVDRDSKHNHPGRYDQENSREIETIVQEPKDQPKTDISLQPSIHQTPGNTLYQSPQYIPRDIQKDFKKLGQMWQAVSKIKIEGDVVDYILKEAPLRIKGAKSAIETLESIFNWHNKWSEFGDKYSELKALDMIAQMQTRAANPEKQNEIYEYIRNRYNKRDLLLIGLSTLKNIDKIIENNKLYLELYLNGWKYRKSIDVERLKSIANDLNFDLLTLEQQIESHYMLARLNEKVPLSVVPECYHYAKSYQLMNKQGSSEILLSWNRWDTVYIYKERLKKNACYFCTKVKGNYTASEEFKNRYRFEIVSLGQLTRGCSDDEMNSER